jgi:hypothetical protein
VRTSCGEAAIGALLIAGVVRLESGREALVDRLESRDTAPELAQRHALRVAAHLGASDRRQRDRLGAGSVHVVALECAIASREPRTSLAAMKLRSS